MHSSVLILQGKRDQKNRQETAKTDWKLYTDTSFMTKRGTGKDDLGQLHIPNGGKNFFKHFNFK